MPTSETRERLIMSGASAEDLAFLDHIGWNPAAVPPIGGASIARYSHIERALNRSIASLTVAGRGDSLEGRLAASIGARIADAREAGEDE
jgi:hypothetical protein